MNNPTASIAGRNAMLAAMATLLNGGSIQFFTGTQPASPDTAITSQTLIATDTFGSPAFGSPSAGSMSANATTAGTAVASGTIAWARLSSSGGVPHVDMSVGTGGTFDIMAATTAIVVGMTIPISSFSLSHP